MLINKRKKLSRNVEYKSKTLKQMKLFHKPLEELKKQLLLKAAKRENKK